MHKSSFGQWLRIVWYRWLFLARLQIQHFQNLDPDSEAQNVEFCKNNVELLLIFVSFYQFKLFEKTFDLLVQKSLENMKESAVDDDLNNWLYFLIGVKFKILTPESESIRVVFQIRIRIPDPQPWLTFIRFCFKILFEQLIFEVSKYF